MENTKQSRMASGSCMENKMIRGHPQQMSFENCCCDCVSLRQHKNTSYHAGYSEFVRHRMEIWSIGTSLPDKLRVVCFLRNAAEFKGYA